MPAVDLVRESALTAGAGRRRSNSLPGTSQANGPHGPGDLWKAGTPRPPPKVQTPPVIAWVGGSSQAQMTEGEGPTQHGVRVGPYAHEPRLKEPAPMSAPPDATAKKTPLHEVHVGL